MGFKAVGTVWIKTVPTCTKRQLHRSTPWSPLCLGKKTDWKERVVISPSGEEAVIMARGAKIYISIHNYKGRVSLIHPKRESKIPFLFYFIIWNCFRELNGVRCTEMLDHI